MKEEDSMMQTRGENVGFIKRFNTREQIRTQSMMQKAAAMVNAPTPSNYAINKISAEAISRLDLNEIGDSEDSVTEL